MSARRHDVSDARSGRRRRLRAALAVTAVVLVLEVAGGLASGSLALLADAAHVLGDIAALTLALAATHLAGRAPTGRHTFGLLRAEVLAAFVNAQILVLVALAILWEAFQRFRSPLPIETGLMLAVGLLGLAGNLVTIRLLAPGRQENLNQKAAFLEVLSDALASAAVVAVALLMGPTGWNWLDPAVSVAVAVVILPRAFGILRQSAHILLEGAPGEVDLAGIRSRLLSLPGVEEVHDLHFWTLTSGLHSCSVHIRAAHDGPAEHEVLASVRGVLQTAGGVDHATIQVECGQGPDCPDSGRQHA